MSTEPKQRAPSDGKSSTTIWVRALLTVTLVAPLGLSITLRATNEARAVKWWEARNDSTQQAPDPSETPEAVIQVYAARAFGWRGALGVHTWIAVKPTEAPYYQRIEVIGWRVSRGGSAVRISTGVPDGYWYGEWPTKLLDLRGTTAEAPIERIIAAAQAYPHSRDYRIWPGPNSNSFIAEIGRQVPELRLDLPPTAIGKDYLPNGGFAASAPSGTGVQLSLFGLLGILLAREEGVELNILGLTFGVDFNPPALKLPGLGRIGSE